jgi:alkylation response protein AidB-like acyl-CoA dehydrogenase
MMAVAAPARTRPALLPPHELDALCARVRAFIEEQAIPREDYSRTHDVEWLDAVTRELRTLAQAQGLVAPQLPREAWGCAGRTARGSSRNAGAASSAPVLSDAPHPISPTSTR